MCYILAENKEQVNDEINSIKGRFRQRYKMSIEKQVILCKAAIINQQETSKNFAKLYELEISISQVNRIRIEYNASRKRGRPSKKKTLEKEDSSGKQIITYKPQAGVSLLSTWMEEQQKHIGQEIYKHF